MEYYNNILCISGSELIIKRGVDGEIESGIIERHTYDNLKKRGHIVVHGYGGRGRDIYIEFDSIARPDIKRMIRERYGDPRKRADIKPFKDSIHADSDASLYFNNYLKDDGTCLTDLQKLQYCNDAALLNAIKTQYERHKTARLSRGKSVRHFWKLALVSVNEYRTSYQRDFDQEYPCTLPNSEKRLRMRYEAYVTEGYAALISGKIGNSNSEKINEAAGLWVIAKWANQISKVPGESQMMALYNKEAAVRGWKPLKNVGTIHNFLFREDVKELWWGHRYGELKAKEKFAIQHSTKLPELRDALWYSDGTKLNYYYMEDGKVCTCQAYEVIDTYSEVLLGYHISKTEDFEAQFRAYKMALQFSGQRPYEVKYDNQGGHKKLENGDFLKKLAHLSIRTAPYNGKSKTIESIFGRFQQQILKQDWFFTGQNITAKKTESKANMEFILANQKNLPSLEEIKQLYALRRDEWNTGAHYKTGKSRIEMYRESQNPKAVKLGMFDMVYLFWITRDKQITCHAGGISFTEKGEKYEYMVYRADRMPDQEWLRKNIDRKFTVKFDPEDMSLIYLYEKTMDGLRMVTAAETKVIVHRAKQEQEDGEAEYFKRIELEAKKLRIETRDKMDEILEIHGLLPEQNGLNSPKIKGIEKNKKKSAVEGAIGKQMKKESNVTVLDDDDFDEKDLYKYY